MISTFASRARISGSLKRSGANCFCVISRSTTAAATQYGTESRAAMLFCTSLLEKCDFTVA